MRRRSEGFGKVVRASYVKWSAIVAAVFLVLVLVPGSIVKASKPDNSSFVGTTYINEHFIMSIGTDGATLYDVETDELLLSNVDWKIEEKRGDVWTPLEWTSGPNLTVGSVGIDNEFHRVSIDGIIDGRLAVSILFDGRPVDVPSMGPKISVVLQTLETSGTFRLLWSFSDFAPKVIQLEDRQGNARRLVKGPIMLPAKAVHNASGDNSFVALSGENIRFGANWQDALDFYRGAAFSRASGKARVDVVFGDIDLDYGEGSVLYVIIEGGGGGPPDVYISNVNVDRNSLSGTETTVTWTTFPSSACDIFRWGTTPSYGNTVNLPCGTHSVTLTGLQTHRTYYFKITSSKSGYDSDTRTGSWYPTDASLSKASESYARTYTAYSFCGPVSTDYTYTAETLGDISFDPAKAGNSNNYEIFDLQLRYESSGQTYCWPWTMGTRYTRVDLWIHDSSGVIDWINARNYVIFEGYVGGSATASIGISVGGSTHGFSTGFSASMSPASGWSWNKDIPTPCVDQGGGTKYCGWFQVNWPMQMTVLGNMIWPLIVTDQKAQPRLWDKVTIEIKFTMTFDGFNGIWWFGNNHQTSRTIILGNGNYNGANILDQYMNIQEGYMTGVE